jgi:RNA polymerase sigma-70 factor (ECF subfamily)
MPAVIRQSPDPSGDSTMQVLSRAQQGDRSALRILIERALPSLRRWTHGRIPRGGRDGVDTDDVLQDAVLRALKRITKFEHHSVDALQHYLRKSVINRIRDIGRRLRRRGVTLELPDAVPDEAPSPEDQAILMERSDRFVRALARLRPIDRQAIILRFELGYTHEEIARRLGKSVEASHMMVSRARKRLVSEMMLLPPLD